MMRRNQKMKTVLTTLLILFAIFMIIYSYYRKSESFAKETTHAKENTYAIQEVVSTETKKVEPETEEVKTTSIDAYTTNIVDMIKSEKDKTVIKTISGMSEVKILRKGKKYHYVSYDNNVGYIDARYVKTGKVSYVIKSVSKDSRKSFMDYKAITLKSSKQYKIQKDYAKTDKTGIRTVNGRFCIALGSYYSHEIGQYIDLILQDGTVIPCILGDAKDDKHTNKDHSIGKDGGVAEFIVNTKKLSNIVKRSGDISYAVGNKWVWNVKEIKIYDKNLFSK